MSIEAAGLVLRQYTPNNPMPKSICRIVKAYICKIWDAFQTLATLISSSIPCCKLNNPFSKAQIKVLTQNGHNPTPATINQLRNKDHLSPSAVNTYLQILRDNHPNLEVIPIESLPNGGLPMLVADKEQLKWSGMRYVAIPVVVSNPLRDHIVTFFVDLPGNTIEYYDPKGLTIADRKGEPLFADYSCDLPEFLKKIAAAYGDQSTELVENTNKHQNDAHNSGVYACDYVKRRLKESAQDIFDKSKGFSEANHQIREEMIQEIFNKTFPDNHQN